MILPDSAGQKKANLGAIEAVVIHTPKRPTKISHLECQSTFVTHMTYTGKPKTYTVTSVTYM